MSWFRKGINHCLAVSIRHFRCCWSDPYMMLCDDCGVPIYIDVFFFLNGCTPSGKHFDPHPWRQDSQCQSLAADALLWPSHSASCLPLFAVAAKQLRLEMMHKSSPKQVKQCEKHQSSSARSHQCPKSPNKNYVQQVKFSKQLSIHWWTRTHQNHI